MKVNNQVVSIDGTGCIELTKPDVLPIHDTDALVNSHTTQGTKAAEAPTDDVDFGAHGNTRVQLSKGSQGFGLSFGGAKDTVRQRCPPIFPRVFSHFRLYEVVSLHMCDRSCTYRKIFKMVPKLTELCNTLGSRPRQTSTGTGSSLRVPSPGVPPSSATTLSWACRCCASTGSTAATRTRTRSRRCSVASARRWSSSSRTRRTSTSGTRHRTARNAAWLTRPSAKPLTSRYGNFAPRHFLIFLLSYQLSGYMRQFRFQYVSFRAYTVKYWECCSS